MHKNDAVVLGLLIVGILSLLGVSIIAANMNINDKFNVAVEAGLVQQQNIGVSGFHWVKPEGDCNE